MIAQERLIKVYNLITAAHALLNKGHMMQAIGFIQTARLIASQSDEFLELNKTQVDEDCDAALALIQKESARSEGEKKGE
jgi:hypothetical protein